VQDAGQGRASVWHVRLDKTMAAMADSQGSLPKTAANAYLDDNMMEL
jgi:hypothetical protein